MELIAPASASKVHDFIIDAVERYLEVVRSDRVNSYFDVIILTATDEKQKMQVFFKAYDPEIEKNRVFFQGPASSATDQTDLFELKFESPSFSELEEILRNEYDFEDGVNDSDLPGTEDYTPPQQNGGVQVDDFGNPIKP